MKSKTAIPENVIQEIRQKAQNTGLFVPAGQDVKCQIERTLTDLEVLSVLDVCKSIADSIRVHGLR